MYISFFAVKGLVDVGSLASVVLDTEASDLLDLRVPVEHARVGAVVALELIDRAGRAQRVVAIFALRKKTTAPAVAMARASTRYLMCVMMSYYCRPARRRHVLWRLRLSRRPRLFAFDAW